MGNVNLILISTAPNGFFRSMMRQRVFGVRFWLNVLSVGVMSVAWAGSAWAAAVYPLKVSANNRYLVDQKNAPFLIMGDCPQSLTVNLSLAQTDSYFSNRQAHGFNTMWANLVCTSYTAAAGRQHFRRDSAIHGIPSRRQRSVAFRPFQAQ